jgi:ubiquinone/menaquinone biosynthesis C-methylase UbiE
MSSYENYTQTSKRYDETRVPVGIEILLGCFARAPVTLEQMTILDAGCGTGSYSQALLDHVGQVEAVDMNEGMLSVAHDKLATACAAGRIAFHKSTIDSLPVDDASVDGVMLNQVLHHIPDDARAGYPAYTRIFSEFARVLKPGGVLVVNTCSHAQLREGWWFYHLLGTAVDAVCAMHIPLDQLNEVLTACGFQIGGHYVPLDAVLQGDAYFAPAGPLDQSWRDGDSMWALVDQQTLASVLATLSDKQVNGELEAYAREHDARRRVVGQVTFVFAQRV